MKRIVVVFIIISIVILCSSCNPENILNSGSRPKTSNVVNENLDFSIPTIKEKGYYQIGEVVEDKTKNASTGIHLSYKITDAKTYNTLEDAELTSDDILMYEVFCNESGTFDTNYKLLLISIDIHCSKKQENSNIRPNITTLSSVGKIKENDIYEPISTEQIYFSKELSTSNNQKDYFYYDINEGETISVLCGWMVPDFANADELFLSIGTVDHSTDGSTTDDSIYISLQKEG